MDDKTTEGRLSRWSKRKMAVAREEAAEATDDAKAVEVTIGEEQDAQDAQLQVELEANREAAEAVDLETLTEESDFSVFMKAGVPEMLKKQAMASLWRTSPIFANVDGLVDYDDDFGSPNLIMKTFKSAYQAGRGDLNLYKEDEEVAEEEVVEAVDEETAEPEEEIESDPETDQENLDENEEFATTELTSAEYESSPVEQPEFIEADPPKVSLRRRLELEQPS